MGRIAEKTSSEWAQEIQREMVLQMLKKLREEKKATEGIMNKVPDGLLRREGERNGDLRVDTYIDQIELKIWEPPIYILSIEQATTLRDRLTRALEEIEGQKAAQAE